MALSLIFDNSFGDSVKSALAKLNNCKIMELLGPLKSVQNAFFCILQRYIHFSVSFFVAI